MLSDLLKSSTLKTFLSIVTAIIILGHSSEILAAHENDFIQSAVENVARPEFDKERDIYRKPEHVLHFFDVRPGMTVVDVFSGSGYYTELLSLVVGPRGKVYSHNNQAYINYVQKKLDKRYLPGRLKNVERVVAEANQIQLANDSIDMIFMILAYHDIYYQPKKGNWPKIDRKDFIDRLFNALKPGGTLAIIDHQAEPGSPSTSGHTLHRIDPSLVIREVKESGFTLMDKADFLENPEDQLDKHMYAPEIRGKTSRFVLKFIKPMSIEKQLVEDTNIP